MLNYKDFVLFKQHPWHLGNISSRISRHTMSWKVNVSLFPPKLSNSASSWVPWEWINCKMLSFWCCFRGTLCPLCRNTNTGKWWVCLYQMYWGGQELWGQLLPPVEMFHAPQLMFGLYLPFYTIHIPTQMPTPGYDLIHFYILFWQLQWNTSLLNIEKCNYFFFTLVSVKGGCFKLKARNLTFHLKKATWAPGL